MSSLIHVLCTPAMDEQASCTFVLLGQVISTETGCYARETITIDIVKFVNSPSNINRYLDPDEDSILVSWEQPRLPARFSDIAVSNNLDVQAPTFNFPAGVQVVRYQTTPLDVGGPLQWEFQVRSCIRCGCVTRSTHPKHRSTSSTDFCCTSKALARSLVA